VEINVLLLRKARRKDDAWHRRGDRATFSGRDGLPPPNLTTAILLYARLNVKGVSASLTLNAGTLLIALPGRRGHPFCLVNGYGP